MPGQKTIEPEPERTIAIVVQQQRPRKDISTINNVVLIAMQEVPLV